jgi:hypothetical protein
MKAMSVRQPWADLILSGRKSLELRTWEPNLRGRILIHAGKAVVEEACRRYGLDRHRLTTGALLGSVEVAGVVRLTPENWSRLATSHLDWGRFAPDLLGWELREPRWLPRPIPWRGALGLFEVPDSVIGPATAPGPEARG